MHPAPATKSPRTRYALCVVFASVLVSCDTPTTQVVIDNQYPATSTNALTIFHAFWEAVAFTTPIPPGSSSDPQDSVPCSPTTAYVLLASGFDPTADGGVSTPTSFMVLKSRDGFGLHLNNTLHIPVDDRAFLGNCTAASFLTQDQADFITQRVFASDFAGLRYDAATCTTSEGP